METSIRSASSSMVRTWLLKIRSYAVDRSLPSKLSAPDGTSTSLRLVRLLGTLTASASDSAMVEPGEKSEDAHLISTLYFRVAEWQVDVLCQPSHSLYSFLHNNQYYEDRC